MKFLLLNRVGWAAKVRQRLFDQQILIIENCRSFSVSFLGKFILIAFQVEGNIFHFDRKLILEQIFDERSFILQDYFCVTFVDMAMRNLLPEFILTGFITFEIFNISLKFKLSIQFGQNSNIVLMNELFISLYVIGTTSNALLAH